MSSLLGCNHLTVRFFEDKEPVLKEVSLHINQGEKVLILGPSGSGKSTIISVLAGIIPEHIEASVSGEVTRKKRAGVLFQNPDTQFCMEHVDEEIAFSLENRKVPREEMDAIIHELLEKVGLAINPHTPIANLSGGMKQRLALASLLALEPEVLFLDEPTAQLDPSGRNEVFEVIKGTAARTGQTMVMVEHVLDGCIEWMDRVILLSENGKIIAEGKPEMVLNQYKAEMQEAGIWFPKVFPYKWEELIQEESHPRRVDLIHKYESKKARIESENIYNPVLETNHLEAAYLKETILDNIDFTVNKGEWIAVIGNNGAGKSTFLKILAHLKKSKKGEIRFQGKELKKWRDRDLYQHLGFVFQNPEFQFINQTVFDEIAFSGIQYQWKEGDIKKRTTELLKEFGLEPYQDQHPFTLSFGQKRRLSVATMLLLDQDILLLDEPTFGQDAKSSHDLLQVLEKRKKEGTSIIMVTHDMDIVDQYADQVVVLHQKKLAFADHPYLLFSNQELCKKLAILPPIHYQLFADLKEVEENQKQRVLSITS
ncbi:MAG: ABC transporter ATP-binding protein [Niallia sp.]|nr:ABC transporter [Mycobacteroides abscessus subsp. abscessus]HEO8422279.1 ABC transporter ATP-binding protein [Yersinia enterocolitica]